MKAKSTTPEVLADQREALRSESDEERQRQAAIASLAQMDPETVFDHLQSLDTRMRRSPKQPTTLQS